MNAARLGAGRLVVLLYAVSGYWQGFVTGAFATTGLLLGGLVGVWLAPFGARRRDPVDPGVAGRDLHRDPLRVARARRCFQGSAPGSATGSPGSRCVLSTRSAAPCSAAAPSLSSPGRSGVALSGSGLRGITPHGARAPRCSPRSTRCCRERRRLRAVGVQRRRRYDASSRATSSRSRRSGSSPCRPGRGGCSPTPTSPGPGPACVRSAAPTSAARASRAPGSSTRPTRVMTNAHVVAGVSDPSRRRRRHLGDGHVVYYDPDVDVAVLAVPTAARSGAAVHRRDDAGQAEGRSRSSAIPQDGPYDVAGRAGSAPSSACARPTSTATAR